MVRYFFSQRQMRHWRYKGITGTECRWKHPEVQKEIFRQHSVEIVRVPVNLPYTQCPRSNRATTLLVIHCLDSFLFPTLLSTHKVLSLVSWPRPQTPQHCCRTSYKSWLRAVYYHELTPVQVCQILARLNSMLCLPS